MKIRSITGACVAALGLVVVMSVSNPMEANAVVEKTGGAKSCSGGAKVGVVGKGTGQVNWYVPRTGSQVMYSNHGGTDYAETYRSTGSSISSWKVTSTGGYLDDNGTKAVCLPPVAPPAAAKR